MFFILRLSLILKLSVIFYTVHSAPSLKHGRCGASFQGSAKEKVKFEATVRKWRIPSFKSSVKEKIEFEINDQGVEHFIKEYGGQKGCVQLSKDLETEMSYIYNLASKLLTKDQMSRLNWQVFQGTAEDFFELSRKILNANGKLKKEYIGMKGYAAFADQHYEGDMRKTYLNVSAVLDKGEMKRLGWQAFLGRTEDFFELRKKLLNAKGELKEEYIGMEGYAAFADQHFQGEMQKTYINVSVVLDKGEMKRLGWQAFHGKTEDFFELRGRFLNAKGELKEEYIGMKGYTDLAKQLYQGDMQKTYINVSAVLDRRAMKRLGWKQFQGASADFFELRGVLFNEKGELKKEHISIKGYTDLADKLYQGEMQKTYINVSAVLNTREMKRLEWQKFHGKSDDFFELREELFNENGKLREKYLGMEGYAAFADQYYKGDMLKTYQNVSAALGGAKSMKQLGLGWKVFHGASADFFELRGELLNENGKLREKYLGMEGYAAFADQYYKGDMLKTYQNVSAALGGAKSMKQLGLGWKVFQGASADFFELREELLNENGKLREKYLGIEGYAAFADQCYKGDMLKTYQNVSAALGGAKSMKQLGLGWKVFHGASADFFELRGELLNENGKLREKYLGIEGYAALAEQHYQGDMEKTFINVSAVLGGAESMKELGLVWKQFEGHVYQYRELKKLFAAKSIEELRGIKGQEYAANTIFKGNTRRTYKNVSVLREEFLGSREAFKKLNWQEN